MLPVKMTMYSLDVVNDTVTKKPGSFSSYTRESRVTGSPNTCLRTCQGRQLASSTV